MRLPAPLTVEHLTGAACIASATIGLLLIREPVPRMRTPEGSSERFSREQDRWPSEDSLLGVADQLTARDPFRVGHEPSSVSSAGAGVTGQAPSVVARPTLQITGVIGSRERWMAIVSGIPGRVGELLLSEGDTVAGLRIIRVRSEEVVVRGADTTWTLTVRRHQ